MVIDEERLSQEQAMLNRLAIGLMAEGVQMTRVVPESLSDEIIAEQERRIALARRIEAPMRVVPWMRRNRTSKVIEKFGKQKPDLVFASGELAWRLGLDLARAWEIPLVLEVWSLSQSQGLRWWGEQPELAACIVPCAGIAHELRLHLESSLLSLAPMGVSIPPQPKQPVQSDVRQPSVAIVGRCKDLGGYRAAMGALCTLLGEVPALQVFLELGGGYEHQVWSLAKRLQLLQSVSAITRSSHYRDLLTCCDLMLIPERLGEPRSIMLEAMALGVPIVAALDPALDMLIDGRTALLVKDLSEDRWLHAIRSVLKNPAEGARIGVQAKALVSASYRSSQQLTAVLRTFQKCLSGGAISFRTPAGVP